MNPVAEVTDLAESAISSDQGGAKWKTTLPEPLLLPWELKPFSSAQSGVKTLEDGRRCFWVPAPTMRARSQASQSAASGIPRRKEEN